MNKLALAVNFLVLLWTARNGGELGVPGTVASAGAGFVLYAGFLRPLVQGWLRVRAENKRGAGRP